MQALEDFSALSSFATAIGVVITAIGVVIAVCQLQLTREQSVTAFEDSLTAQYRQIASTLPLKALFGESLTTQEHNAHLQYFYRYFDLCNEQAFLHKNGRVSDSTWAFWEDGILTNFRRPAFDKAWQEVANRARDDFNELRSLCPPNAASAAQPNAEVTGCKRPVG